MQTALALIGFGGKFDVTLDIGCGAGMSLLPLLPLSEKAFGVDPAFSMVSTARDIAAPALLACARGEELPFRSGAFDLITAAGSLNYSNPALVLAEARRVLKPGGIFCAYDFSQGRDAVSNSSLGLWFEEFERRYSAPLHDAIPLDPQSIARIASGFHVASERELRLSHPMSIRAYTAYLLTETNVAAAIRHGTAEPGIKQWLETTLAPVFGGATLEVLFSGYLICLRRG